MLMKMSENELLNVSVIKHNAQGLNIYKTTLHPVKTIFCRRLKSCVTYVTSNKLHHSSNILFLEISLIF